MDDTERVVFDFVDDAIFPVAFPAVKVCKFVFERFGLSFALVNVIVFNAFSHIPHIFFAVDIRVFRRLVREQ